MFNASPTGLQSVTDKDAASPIDIATKQEMSVEDLNADTSPLPPMSHAEMVVKKGIKTDDEFFKSQIYKDYQKKTDPFYSSEL